MEGNMNMEAAEVTRREAVRAMGIAAAAAALGVAGLGAAPEAAYAKTSKRYFWNMDITTIVRIGRRQKKVTGVTVRNSKTGKALKHGRDFIYTVNYYYTKKKQKKLKRAFVTIHGQGKYYGTLHQDVAVE